MKLMTEAEWEQSTDPRWMLLQVERRILSRRKSLLFTAACLHRIWPILMYEGSRNAVEVLERVADGLASVEEQHVALLASKTAADTARKDYDEVTDPDRHSINTIVAVRDGAIATHSAIEQVTSNGSPAHAIYYAANARSLWDGGVRHLLSGSSESAPQADFLRDIVGPLPFRPFPPQMHPALFTWGDDLIPRLARSIYENRTFDGLPILADALEDAGCIDSDILNHCRGPGPHVRGCWVVDLLLGKE